MPLFRDRDDDSSSTNTALTVLVGAMAGFAVGMFVAHRVGGISGLASKVRRQRGTLEDQSLNAAHGVADEEEFEEFEDVEEDELESSTYDRALEEHVLEAFRNDPILSQRAIDIGAISDGVIELAGWVDDDAESQQAVTIARGIPGVETVINRILVGDDERRFDAATRRERDDEPPNRNATWEGQRVGTGRRRQGTSSEPDRHEDPKVELEDRWMREDLAVRDAAGGTLSKGERTRRSAAKRRGDRTGGAPVTPGGVPKADHVANPRVGRSARIDLARETGGDTMDDSDQG
jgi:BON domain